MNSVLKNWLQDLAKVVKTAIDTPKPLPNSDGFACIKAIETDDGRGCVVMVVSGTLEYVGDWMERALKDNMQAVERSRALALHEQPPPQSIQ